MTVVAYGSPWVPPEWIAAHGLEARWMRPGSHRPEVAEHQGLCPFAAATIGTVLAGGADDAVVLTTTCDQMRYAAALIERERTGPVFLMNVPSTWQSDGARRLYRDELERLGRFFVEYGGSTPSREDLWRSMLRFDRARANARQAATWLRARHAAEVTAHFRSTHVVPDASGLEVRPDGGVPLALLGGPVAREDLELLDLIERAGGRVVLDATESGERTLAAPLHWKRLRDDPIEELVRAYFDSIPDVFQRPNDRLYRWLDEQIVGRRVRGVLVHRYVWCDLWHAELARLKEAIGVPVLELDAGTGDGMSSGRTASRVEAFLEMLADR